jgi:ABC-type anion transport system duplicated permease subunit
LKLKFSNPFNFAAFTSYSWVVVFSLYKKLEKNPGDRMALAEDVELNEILL